MDGSADFPRACSHGLTHCAEDEAHDKDPAVIAPRNHHVDRSSGYGSDRQSLARLCSVLCGYAVDGLPACVVVDPRGALTSRA
jgi:hypothetical protein